MNRSFLLGLLFSAVFSSCNSASAEKTEKKTVADNKVEQPAVKVPVFNQDSAYAYVDAQCSFGPRVPNSKNHEACLAYLEKKMQSLGAKVTLQKADLKAFDGTVLKSTNVISSFFPDRNKRVVLFSHWDSRPFSDQEQSAADQKKPVMGANDGASGVGVLMEVARNIAATDPKIGVDIVFLDAEDYGAPHNVESKVQDDWCLGSQYWSKNTGYTTANKPFVGILLDMVGGVDPVFSIDAISEYYASVFAVDFWRTAENMGFTSFFPMDRGGQIVDDHYYVNKIADIPTFDIIDYSISRGFPEMWHTQHDDMAHIDKETIGIVGRVILRYLYINCAK